MGIGSTTGSNGSELTRQGSTLKRFPVRAGNDNKWQFVDQASPGSKSRLLSFAQSSEFQVNQLILKGACSMLCVINQG